MLDLFDDVLAIPTCRVCGCTEADCTPCIERTGKACYWIETGLCSACRDQPPLPFPAPLRTSPSPADELAARCALQRQSRR